MALLTIQKDFRQEIIIEKSRFICTLRKISSEEEAIEKLKEIKKEFGDASHNCFAYIVGENGEIQRSSDDGEPSGTAGIPMLEVLRKRHLHNVLAVVTRYFGGVKLGTGGLIRTYGKSVNEAIEVAGIAEKQLFSFYSFEEDPLKSGKTLHLLYTQEAFSVAEINYSEKTFFVLRMKEEDKEQILLSLQNLLLKEFDFSLVCQEYVEVPLTFGSTTK